MRNRKRAPRPFFDGPTVACLAGMSILLLLTLLNELGQWMYP